MTIGIFNCDRRRVAAGATYVRLLLSVFLWAVQVWGRRWAVSTNSVRRAYGVTTLKIYPRSASLAGDSQDPSSDRAHGGHFGAAQ
jgi:hypothetical protein